MLTIQDLHATLLDERHGGWGYARCVETLPASKREPLDKAIVAVANGLELTKEELFQWSDSKHGRWLRDEAEEVSPTRTLVRKHLNRQIISALMNEVDHEAVIA